MANFMQLQAQIVKLQKEAESLRKRELAETIAKIKKAIAAFGLTAHDLGLAQSTTNQSEPANLKTAHVKRRGRPTKLGSGLSDNAFRQKKGEEVRSLKNGHVRADKRSVVAPKYRDASSGSTWTGRGKQPKWLTNALLNGKTLQDFKI